MAEATTAYFSCKTNSNNLNTKTMSGYRDDFYVPENIIGYTGKLGENPTIYFEKREDGKVTFGRITQQHGNPKNVGREMIRMRSESDYDAKNTYAAEIDGKNVTRKDYSEKNKGNLKVIEMNTYQNLKNGEIVQFNRVYAEFYDNDLSHLSRSVFTKVTDKNKQELADAIIKKENLKIKEIHTGKDISFEKEMQEMVGKDPDELWADISKDDKNLSTPVKTSEEQLKAPDVDQKIDYRAFAEVKVTDNVRRENTRNSRPRRNSAESNKGQKNVNKPGL